MNDMKIGDAGEGRIARDLVPSPDPEFVSPAGFVQSDTSEAIAARLSREMLEGAPNTVETLADQTSVPE